MENDKGCVILTQSEYNDLIQKANKPSETVKDYNKVNITLRVVGNEVLNSVYDKDALYRMDFFKNYLLSIGGDLTLSQQVHEYVNDLAKSLKKEINEYNKNATEEVQKFFDEKMSELSQKEKAIQEREINIDKVLLDAYNRYYDNLKKSHWWDRLFASRKTLENKKG